MFLKCIKVFMILVMILAVAFSIVTITTGTTQATMTEELLHEKGTPGEPGYEWWCDGVGQGCYTIIEPT